MDSMKNRNELQFVGASTKRDERAVPESSLDSRKDNDREAGLATLYHQINSYNNETLGIRIG